MLLRPLKLRVPEVSRAWVNRIDVAAPLHDGVRVLAVVAGPGFGKTVLATQVAASWPGTVFWYVCDEVDADLAVFAAHLATLTDAPVASTGTPPPAPEEVAANALDAFLKRPGALVVFDDVHRLSGASLGALTDLIRRGAALGVSFLLGGRELPLPAHRFASHGSFALISAAELVFDEQRSRDYLANAFGNRLDARRIAELARQIGGWPAGLALAAAVPAREFCGDAPLDAPSFEMLFDYLATEVFASLDPGDRRFLLDICVLDDLETDACDAVAQTTDARQRLNRLAKLGLFVASRDADAFEMQHLFKSFLRDRLGREYAEPARNDVHVRAADFFAQRGDAAKSIEHRLAAGQYDAAAAALAGVALPLVATGQADRVDRLLTALGPQRVAADPLLGVARGRLLHAAGAWDEALRTLGAAEALARRHDAPDAAAEAVRAMAPMLGARGERERLSALIDGVLALDLSDAKRATVSISLGAHLLECERFDEVLELYARIGPLVAELDDLALQGIMLHNTGVAHMRRGDPFAAQTFYERALRAKRASGQRRSALVTLGNLSVVLRTLGEIAEATRISTECTNEARRIGDVTMLIHGLESAGALALAAGEPATAAAAFEEARSLCDPGDAIFLPYVLHGLAQVALRRGELAEAATTCSRAISLLRGDGDLQRRAAVILTRARVALAAGDPISARNFARGACELAERGPNALESATLQFEVAAVMLAVAAALPPAEADEARNAGRAAARKALSLESVRDYSFLHRTHAEAVKASHVLLAIDDPPAATLRIALFGAMRVIRDGVDVEAGAWKRRKAREILAYLVLERGRLVPRARLVDVFWPEADADAASDNLRVAVSAVRRAAGNVIRFENGGYRFAAPAGTTVDLDRFEDSLALARRLGDPAAASTAYAEALEVYSGDLLDGFEDASWCLHERARLRDGALEAARALVATPDAATVARSRALERLLALAPLDPEAMRARLDVLAGAKRVGEARAEYERWQRRYAEALGEAPPDIWHPPRLAVVPSTG